MLNDLGGPRGGTPCPCSTWLLAGPLGPLAWAARLGRLPGPPAWAARLDRSPGPLAWAARLGRSPGRLDVPQTTLLDLLRLAKKNDGPIVELASQNLQRSPCIVRAMPRL